MGREQTSGPTRRVRAFTLGGTVEGSIRVGPRLRTLDDLNTAQKGFIVLYAPEPGEDGCSIGTEPLAVNRSRILFVSELSEWEPISYEGDLRYARAAISLQVGPYALQGFVHVPPDGDPFMRLNQQNRSFIGLTSVSVIGPDLQFVCPFLAVNRSHIDSAQAICPEVPAAEPPAASVIRA